MNDSYEDGELICPYCNREDSICDCTEEEIEQMYAEWEAAEDAHDRNTLSAKQCRKGPLTMDKRRSIRRRIG